MSHTRRLVAGAATAIATLALVPATSAAAPDGSLKGLVLTGGCPGQSSELKNLIVTPQTRFLFAPLRLYDANYQPTGKWLFPYTVLVTGEGLKTRHLTPDVPYIRPGRTPANQVTCIFDGATKEDGPFTVQITGPIRGR